MSAPRHHHLQPVTPRGGDRVAAAAADAGVRRDSKCSDKLLVASLATSTNRSAPSVAAQPHGRLLSVWARRRARNIAASPDGRLRAAQSALGPSGCLACGREACSWRPAFKGTALSSRLEQVERELLRVRCEPSTQASRSVIALGYHRGAPACRPQREIVFELAFEAARLRDAQVRGGMQAARERTHLASRGPTEAASDETVRNSHPLTPLTRMANAETQRAR